MKRRWLLAGLGAGTFLACIVIIGVVWALHRVATGPEKLVWRLHKDATPNEVGWPAGASGDVFDRRGQFDLTIYDSFGRIYFHDAAQHIICERKGNRLGNLYIHFKTDCTAEEAYQTLKSMMVQWNCPPDSLRDLETWHQALINRTSHFEFVSKHQYDRSYQGDCGIYPSGEFGKFGSPIRASKTDGRPEEGNCRFTLSTML
jgi:hypothetical protein